jgi:hypothetical protein
MWSKILAIFEAIKALVYLVRELRSWQEQRKKDEEAKRIKDLEDALKRLGDAKSEEEFDRAQDDVVNPKP